VPQADTGSNRMWV